MGVQIAAQRKFLSRIVRENDAYLDVGLSVGGGENQVFCRFLKAESVTLQEMI